MADGEDGTLRMLATRAVERAMRAEVLIEAHCDTDNKFHAEFKEALASMKAERAADSERTSLSFVSLHEKIDSAAGAQTRLVIRFLMAFTAVLITSLGYFLIRFGLPGENYEQFPRRPNSGIQRGSDESFDQLSEPWCYYGPLFRAADPIRASQAVATKSAYRRSAGGDSQAQVTGGRLPRFINPSSRPMQWALGDECDTGPVVAPIWNCHGLCLDDQWQRGMGRVRYG